MCTQTSKIFTKLIRSIVNGISNTYTQRGMIASMGMLKAATTTNWITMTDELSFLNILFVLKLLNNFSIVTAQGGAILPSSDRQHPSIKQTTPLYGLKRLAMFFTIRTQSCNGNFRSTTYGLPVRKSLCRSYP